MPLVNGSWQIGLHGAGTTLGVFAVVTRGSDVYVGGEFHIAGDVIVHNLARWDGSTWHPVGGGTPRGVSPLPVDRAANPYPPGGCTTARGTTGARRAPPRATPLAPPRRHPQSPAIHAPSS